MVGRRTFGIGILVAIAATACSLLFGAGTSQAAATKKPYLALGDSVAFGYIAGAGFEYGNPVNFTGFPDDVGRALGLTAVNAACPGETTSSFLSATGQDNGCRAFRAGARLHVGYTGTQLQYATSYLKKHKNTKLVTIQLGANDGFILEGGCKLDPTCIQNGVPALLATVAHDMATALAAIRGTGYKGRLIVVDYYSLDYTDAGATQLTSLLNGALTGAVSAYKATVADVFGAFQKATGNGNPCTAGLLNPNPDPAATPSAAPSCDVHPSRAGQLLLAQTVEAAYHAKG